LKSDLIQRQYELIQVRIFDKLLETVLQVPKYD